MAKQQGPNILETVNFDSYVRNKLTEIFADIDKQTHNRVFYLGEVINSKDDLNANRLQVRIPLLDDIFYLDEDNKKKEGIGDEKLPWCISAKGRHIDTPEDNSIVLVGVLNPLVPFAGRIWFSAINKESLKDIFDASLLTEELVEDNNWENAEKILTVAFNNTPTKNDRKAYQKKQKKVNYKTGVKGKDKNKLLFDEKKTTLVQNEGEDKETLIELTEDFKLKSGAIELLSRNSKRKEVPIFADPLLQHIDKQNKLINAIIQMLAKSPGLAFGTPCQPSPEAAKLIAQYGQLLVDYTDLKTNGKSKDIKIN